MENKRMITIEMACSINGIIAYPPPKVKAPILNKDINNSISFFI